MFGFIRRLIAGDAGEHKTHSRKKQGKGTHWSDQSTGTRATDNYFGTMLQMREAVSKRSYNEAGQFVRENLSFISNWVRETCEEYGCFDISSIPTLETGGTVLALLGDDEGLKRMREIVVSTSELAPWIEKVNRHQQDRELFQAILQAVSAHPNCLQREVKGIIGFPDGRRVANLISYLEKAGKITRIKTGSTYRLVPPGSPTVPKTPPKMEIKSHRTDPRPPVLQEINISALSYVPLPRAPQRWEEAQARRGRAASAKAKDHFETRDADWQIAGIERIPLPERPDTAFRKMHPTSSGLILIDDLGKAVGFGQIEAAALRYDRTGELVAKAGLTHGVYRVGVHPLGCGLIAMSRGCVLHAYNDNLDPILETALNKAPEVLTLQRRFEIPDNRAKNYIRCVALSHDMTRYVFTTVDEAWCIDESGRGLWGVKLPIKDGWKRVTTARSEFGTSADVDRALAIMDLTLPVTPADIKGRYRELAKQWHPDLNPGDAGALEKMKALTAAAEVLTGIDARDLPRFTDGIFEQELTREEFEAGGMSFTMRISSQRSEIHVSDWIYAAAFGAKSLSVYLAGYSGRVILVDEYGKAVRAYDVGSVPRRIIDTGEFLYLLTDTRLYVLRNDALHAIVDTLDRGELLVAQTGFGLLEPKRLSWFHQDGNYQGSVVTKHPIRRVYSTRDRMIVETRQQRAVVQGPPIWWN